jgi:ribosomal protein S17E
MPCTKCEEGKYKWGETGDCKYDTLQECEDANSYEEMKLTSIVELVIDETSEELAIDCISLVSAPAIEQDFVFFGKEKNNLTFAKVDEEKRMLVSPALIPDKQIFRHDPQTSSDYYVYFSKSTVRQASELYLKNNNHHKATQEHEERVSGVLTVKSGTLKGLSIEGYFTDKMEKMSEKTPTDQEILKALNEMLNPKLENIAKELSKTQNLEDYPWDQCIADQTKAHSKEEAEKICGYIKSKYGN